MPDTADAAGSLLQDIERRLRTVDARLLAAGPDGLEDACVELRNATVAFADVLEAVLAQGTPRTALRSRIAAVAQRLHEQRTCVARRGVMVERALHSILRPPPAATYRIDGERTMFETAAAAAAAHR